MAFAAIGIGLGVAATAASAGMSMANSGGKPNVPNAPVVDLVEEQRKAIAANKANLPQAEALTKQANLFSQEQITQMLNSVIPNFAGISGSASADIASMLRGEIPNDVASARIRGSGAKAMSLGIGGSGAHGDLVARDLGLTSLQLTQQGLSSAESWMSTMGKLYEPGMMNVSSMFITPQQQYAASEKNAQNQFDVAWQREQISAMPDPQLSAISKGLGGLGSGLTSGIGSLSKVGAFGGGGGSDGTGFSWASGTFDPFGDAVGNYDPSGGWI